MIGVTLVMLLLAGCGPPEGVISGKVIGPQGLISAEVSLLACQNDDCDEFVTVTPDTGGKYKFSNVSPGWYMLSAKVIYKSNGTEMMKVSVKEKLYFSGKGMVENFDFSK